MKKIYLFIALLITPLSINALEINSENYILYNLTDENVVMEEKSNEQIYVASLTKITTAIVAIEHISNLDETVSIPQSVFNDIYATGASVAGFRTGQIVTYEDLLYGLMLPSGADAALSLAYFISGSESEYVKLMNDFADKLELEHTNFTNTTGLYNESNYSSISDVLKILKYALDNEIFYNIYTSEKYLTYDKSITFTNSFVKINNENNLTNHYILGGKTGYINQAGLCFSSISNINNINYILITAGADHLNGSPLHIIDAHNIYDYVDDNFKYVYPYKKNDILEYIDVKYSDIYQYTIKATDTFQFLTDTASSGEFSYKFVGVDYLTPDTKTGKIGEIEVIFNEEVIHKMDVNYDGSITYSLQGIFSVYWKNILTSLILGIVIIVAAFRVFKKKY